MEYNDNNLNQIFKNLKQQIIENTETIDELYKIDSKYTKMQINLQSFVELIEKFKNCQIKMQDNKTFLIHYNGNPYITLNLIILTILTKNKIILDINNCFLGINSLIIKLTNNILKQYQDEELVSIFNNDKHNADKIVCIDDINKYNNYLRKKINNVKFYSFNYMDFYSDSDEFENLSELIYEYANNNQIAIESYSELRIDKAINLINKGFGKIVVVLTQNDETKKTFRETIKNKEVYINKNPFEQNKYVIGVEIFN